MASVETAGADIRRHAPVSPRFQSNCGGASSPRFPRQTLDDLEIKMMRHLEKAQQRSDQGKEMLRTWAEAKLANVSSLQTKGDLRIAELSGNYAALSDELQLQVRRSELADQNMWQWRRQLEEEFRTKMADSDLAFSELSSSTRSAVAVVEEAVNRTSKQLRNLEAIVAERLRTVPGLDFIEETLQRIELLEERSEMSEGSKALIPVLGEFAAAEVPVPSMENEIVADFERQMGDMSKVLLQLQETSSETGRKLEVHEERMKSMRTIVDQLRESLVALSGKADVPSELESKIARATRSLDDTRLPAHWTSARIKLEPRLDQMDSFQRSLNEVFESLEKLETSHRFATASVSHQVSSRTATATATVREVIRIEEPFSSPPFVDPQGLTFDGLAQTNVLAGRVAVLEESLAHHEAESWLERLRRLEDFAATQQSNSNESNEISERLRILIRQLAELAPKVEAHDSSIKTLLESGASKPAQPLPLPGLMEILGDRVSSCEDQMERLSSEVSKALGELLVLNEKCSAPVPTASKSSEHETPDTSMDTSAPASAGSRDLQTLAARMERSSQDTIGALDDLATRLQAYDGAFAGLLSRFEVDDAAGAGSQRSVVKQVTTSVISKAVAREAEERARAAAVERPSRRRGTGELQDELRWVRSLQQELASSGPAIESAQVDTMPAGSRASMGPDDATATPVPVPGTPDSKVVAHALMHQVYRRGLDESGQDS